MTDIKASTQYQATSISSFPLLHNQLPHSTTMFPYVYVNNTNKEDTTNGNNVNLT